MKKLKLKLTRDTLDGNDYSCNTLILSIKESEPLDLDKILPKLKRDISDLAVDYGFEVAKENW